VVTQPVVVEKGSEELDNNQQSVVKSKKVGTFKVSYYCTEDYPHICNNGNLITATGTIVTAYRSLAVDPSIIPLGTHVLLVINGEEYNLIAEDTGGSIKQRRIDVAVPTHQEALQRGIDEGVLYITQEVETLPISFYIEQTER